MLKPFTPLFSDFFQTLVKIYCIQSIVDGIGNKEIEVMSSEASKAVGRSE